MKRELSIAFQTDKSPGEYTALAKLVNEYAFDRVSVYCDAPFQPSFGPLLLMAPHIQRAMIGPAAVSPFRIHPIDIAAETALLEQLAPGRVYLGLARGAWLEAHGITEPAKPIKGILEAIVIIRKLLAGEDGGYAGEVFNIAPGVRARYPLPTDRIPLMIGTWGRKLAALAGELADEVKVGGSANPDFVPVMRGYIQEGERFSGRAAGSVGIAVGAVSVIDEDRELARRAAKEAVAMYLPVVAPLDPTVQVDPELVQRVAHHVSVGETGQAAGLISDELLEKFAFAGDAGDFIRQTGALFDAGATCVKIVRILITSDPYSMHLVME